MERSDNVVLLRMLTSPNTHYHTYGKFTRSPESQIPPHFRHTVVASALEWVPLKLDEQRVKHCLSVLALSNYVMLTLEKYQALPTIHVSVQGSLGTRLGLTNKSENWFWSLISFSFLTALSFHYHGNLTEPKAHWSTTPVLQYLDLPYQSSQIATEVCREMWVWSIASPPRGQVYSPCAQCSIIFCLKNHKILSPTPLGNNYIGPVWFGILRPSFFPFRCKN